MDRSLPCCLASLTREFKPCHVPGMLLEFVIIRVRPVFSFLVYDLEITLPFSITCCVVVMNKTRVRAPLWRMEVHRRLVRTESTPVVARFATSNTNQMCLGWQGFHLLLVEKQFIQETTQTMTSLVKISSGDTISCRKAASTSR